MSLHMVMQMLCSGVQLSSPSTQHSHADLLHPVRRQHAASDVNAVQCEITAGYIRAMAGGSASQTAQLSSQIGIIPAEPMEYEHTATTGIPLRFFDDVSVLSRANDNEQVRAVSVPHRSVHSRQRQCGTAEEAR